MQLRNACGRLLMYDHILIATDGSDLAQRAVEQGLALAKTLGSRVTAVTVTEPWTAAVSGEWAVAFPVEDYEKAAAANAEKVLDAVQEAAMRLGVICDAVHVKDQYAAEGIVEEAKARSCDLIVMASHGRRGIAKFVLGSQATRVLAHSAVPLLICRCPRTRTSVVHVHVVVAAGIGAAGRRHCEGDVDLAGVLE